MTTVPLDPPRRQALPPLTSDRPVPRWLIGGAFILIAAFYALLWCPYWYPLSDSSLYMILARGLMQGRGLGFLRQVHRDVRPLTPMMLYGIIKCGGGIGAIHIAMIALTLVSHFLAFLTLRRWFNERIALIATIVMASGWWMFANAFTIMTEPIFLAAVWGSLLTIEGVPRAKSAAAKWGRVVLGVLLLLAAFEDRIATVPLIPAVMFGLWMSNLAASVRRRIGWMCVFGLVFAGAWLEWRRPVFLFGKPAAAQAITGGVGVAKVEDEDAGPDAYKLNALVNVTNPLVQLPVSGGRWITESLAAAASYPFGAKIPIALQWTAGVAVFGVFLLVCVGWFQLLREQKWYVVGMALYFGVFWIMWGNRIKPRYMFPILPQLFIQWWLGATVVLWKLRSKRKPASAESFMALSRWIGGILAAGIIALNFPPYAIEVYMRRQTTLNFYDIARRGAFGELVDIGGFLQKNSNPNAGIWMNWGPNRRVLGFLADRDFKVLPPIHKHGTGNIAIGSPADRKHLKLYFSQIEKWDKTAEWAVVFYDQNPWPTYHLPLAKTARNVNAPPRWWQLYRREKRSEKWIPVTVPVDRDYVRAVPGIHDRPTTGGGQ